ncbi:MAG: hypothetical protein LUC88_09160 [Prevotella sp.]|nr:hypothetical protein [Prevotella sp.]
MTKRIITFCILLYCISSLAQLDEDMEKISSSLQLENMQLRSDCDTVINYNGFFIKVIKNDNVYSHIGLNLFSDDLRKTVGTGMLDFVETSLLLNMLEIDDDGYSNRMFIANGSITDFKDINPYTECHITNDDSSQLVIEWTVNNNHVILRIPINYLNANSGSRTEIENGLIRKICESHNKRCPAKFFDDFDLQPYKDILYILPGETYYNNDITSSTYFVKNDTILPVWDEKYPLESIADLFLYPSEIYGDIPLSLTILKHEYGEKDSLTICLEQLLATCEDEGCAPFWGVEKFNGDSLIGALFLYNQQQGYDHVLKIECNPVDVINGNGIIKARASLFIPTNNVENLNVLSW